MVVVVVMVVIVEVVSRGMPLSSATAFKFFLMTFANIAFTSKSLRAAGKAVAHFSHPSSNSISP